ncbi:hypothetical protein FACS189420_7410 [Bacteroidia bacterium]|nr:hypothetical protein FACS189420_7410 [Bacteroidia bacterium]
MKRKITYLLFLLLLTLHACLDSPDMTQGIVNKKQKPTVITNDDFEIPVEGTIRMKGEITLTGEGNLTDKGFYWGYSAQNLDKIIHITDNTNAFYYELSNMPGDKTYYWMAFAGNEFGIDSGKVVKYEAPQIFEAMEEFRSSLRMRFAHFSLNNKLYIVCGQGNVGSLSEVWEYNIYENKWWGNIGNFPGDARRYPVSFIVNNTAYIGTGQRDASTLFNDFYRFNGFLRAWDIQSIIPTDGTEEMARRYQAVGFNLHNKGYVVGGTSASISRNDVWQFSVQNDHVGQWKKMNNFIVPFHGGISIFNEDRVFVGFGDNSESNKILWEYNEASDTWEEFVTLPDTINEKLYSGAIIQNKIYFIDGNNVIWELSLSDKTWKKKVTLPTEFLHTDEVGQYLFTTNDSNSIFIGLGFSQYFYEYRPLWDN